MSAEDLEEEALEMDEVLEKVTFYCLDEAKGKLAEGDECVPFTAVVDGDQMFVETYPDSDVETCRANALHNVRSASTFASHYAFCYDGFLMTDDGQVDAVIVECANRDMDQAYIIALLYRPEGEGVEFEKQPAFVDNGETFFDRAAVAAAKAEEARRAQDEADFDEAVGSRG